MIISAYFALLAKAAFFSHAKSCASDFLMFSFIFYVSAHYAQSRCALSRNFRNKSKYAKLDCGLFKAEVGIDTCK
jgi:hypothetical protein